MLRLKSLVAACVLALLSGNAKAVTYNYQLSVTGISQYGVGYLDGFFSGPIDAPVYGGSRGFSSFGGTQALVQYTLPTLPPPTSDFAIGYWGTTPFSFVTSTGTLGPAGWDLSSPSTYTQGFTLYIAGDLFAGGAVSGSFYAGVEECFLLTHDCPSGRVGFVVTSGTLTATPVPDVPLPAALPLFATGLGALGLLGWRRKRKLAASD